MKLILETIRVNQMKECYVRPIVYRGYHSLGVNPFPCPVDSAILIWEWGKYLGEEALEKGVDVCVSSWNRMAPNTFPAMAKASANYMNSQLIRMEAIVGGFVEGIALDPSVMSAKAAAKMYFCVWRGKIYTPNLASSILSWDYSRYSNSHLPKILVMKLWKMRFRENFYTLRMKYL